MCMGCGELQMEPVSTTAINCGVLYFFLRDEKNSTRIIKLIHIVCLRSGWMEVQLHVFLTWNELEFLAEFTQHFRGHRSSERYAATAVHNRCSQCNNWRLRE